MKRTLAIIITTIVVGFLACYNEESLKISSSDPVVPRICTGTWTYVHYNEGKCRRDCESGHSFRCGGYWVSCSNYVLSNGVIPVKCRNDAYSETVNFVPLPELDQEMPIIESKFEILSPTELEVTFLQDITDEAFVEDPYVTIENNFRIEHSTGLSFGTSQVYHYFQLIGGDYLIDTTASTYGKALIDISSY